MLASNLKQVAHCLKSGEPITSGSVKIIPRKSAKREWYGFEFLDNFSQLQRDLKDPNAMQHPAAWLLANMENFLPGSKQQKIHAIDIGGASGHWAMELAKQGMDVAIVDLNSVKVKQILALRNEQLAKNPDSGKLHLHIADIRKLDAATLTNFCSGAAPSIVTAFNLIHFLQPNELTKFISLVRDTVEQGSIFALSYISAKNLEAKGPCPTPGAFHHFYEEVRAEIEGVGFKEIAACKPERGADVWHAFSLMS